MLQKLIIDCMHSKIEIEEENQEEKSQKSDCTFEDKYKDT